MCGLAGAVSSGARRFRTDEASIRAMTDALIHRGPDDSGLWVDAQAGVVLGSRRLAIIDLSAAGHMPMNSSCGQVVVAYNGEVYNAGELRAELEAVGRKFRGTSDTEVIVEGCAVWGVEKTIRRLIGMFAIAVWEKRFQRLSLVRDRLGIKPLYWWWSEGRIVFASELKALMCHPDFSRQVDRDSAAAFLRFSYVPAPHTIFQDVYKLEPGQLLTLDRDGEPRLSKFWSMDEVARTGLAGRATVRDEREVQGELENLLKDAVRRRMISDVPLGAFLSGGIDSSTIVALMQTQSDRPIRTFSIGFHQSGYNEAEHAAAVARHLGTDHTEMYVTPEDAMAVIPSMPDYYDEPFADSSQIPTYLISRLTKQHVTVALSGDGGDEVFCGYTRYLAAQRYALLLFNTPQPLRSSLSAVLRQVPPQAWDRIFALVPRSHRPSHPATKMHKLAELLRSGPNDVYRQLVSHWTTPADLISGTEEKQSPAWSEASGIDFPDMIDRMQYLDTITYLPDDILTKVDRASMAVSLEVRVPFLDHRVVEYVWGLPQHMKLRSGETKWILRQILDSYVPRSLIDRPKMGFGVPIGEWMRGPLKEWAGDMLSETSLAKFGLISPGPVQQRWREHLAGQANWEYLLWDVLMLQSWCDRYLR